MSAGTIEFLKAVRRGVDPLAVLQQDLDKTLQELQAKTDTVRTALVSKQEAVEAQAAPLTQRVTELDVIQPGQEQVDALQIQVQELQVVQMQLQGNLVEKKQELQTRQQQASQLSSQLSELARRVQRQQQARPAWEGAFLQVAAKGTEFAGTNFGAKPTHRYGPHTTSKK